MGYFPRRFPSAWLGTWALRRAGARARPPLPGLGQRRRWPSYKPAFFCYFGFFFFLIVGADSSRCPRLPLKRRVLRGFPAPLTACVVYAYISTNTVLNAFCQDVSSPSMCVRARACVYVSFLTAFLGSGVLFYCSEDTLLYNVYIF